MEYRKLPHGDEQISVIGLGTSVVGEHSVQNVVETVTFALDNGVNYIDLAGGHAAIFPGIGEALAGRRKDAYVQLHFGADYTSGEYGWNPTLDGVKKSVAWQLAQLKTDYIDFGFMHCLDEAGDLLEDLSAAVLKQAAQQQAALEAALRGQKWFEGVKKQLRPIQPGLADAPAPEKRPDYTPPDTAALTRKTAPESLETFYVLAFKTTGKSPSRGEIAQLSILKFRRFAPESALTACVSPENGLTKYAREAGVTERMTQDAPRLARLLPAVDAYLGENAPLILFRADELAFLSAAGSEAVCMKRPVYDVRTLTGRTSESLADAFGAAFEFVPAMADAEDEALACGLLFCGLADRVLHLTGKR